MRKVKRRKLEKQTRETFIMQIMLRKDGKETGPFTKDEVVTMLADGRISKTCLAFTEGFSNWLPVVAVLTPRPAEVPVEEKRTDFVSSRAKPNETFSKIVSQTSSLDWKLVIPFEACLQDKPWNLIWVRWVLWFIGSMVLVEHLAAGSASSTGAAVFLVAGNWCVAWALAFFFLIKPEQMQVSTLSILLFPSSALLLLLLVVAGQIHFLSSVYQAMTDDSPFKRLAAVFITSLINQIILAGPFIKRYRQSGREESLAAIIYYGFITGLALGLVPGLHGLILQKWPNVSANSLGSYESQDLPTLLSLPILNGLWGAMMGGLIASAVKHEKTPYGWMLAAVIVPAALSTIYLASTSVIVGLLVVCISTFSVVVYLKMHKES